MLPPPTLTFTIPSIHDDTVLDCRIYHPTALSSPGWKKKAAIVAHPYAPLGGCYDDPVLDIVGGVILKCGFVLGTFNFRGAGNSKGRTSWTARPEKDDYISIVGFMIYYLHYLHPSSASQGEMNVEELRHSLTTIPSQALPPFRSIPSHTPPSPDQKASRNTVQEKESEGLLLLAGYSYGSLITTHLPPTPTIISLFSSPHIGSAASEIRLRASHLSKQQNDILALLHSPVSSYRGRPSLIFGDGERLNVPHSPGVRIGGEETNPSVRRASQERQRSIDGARLRKSLDRVCSLSHHNLPSSPRHASYSSQISEKAPFKKYGRESAISIPDEQTSASPKQKTDMVPKMEAIEIMEFRTAYLLVSPLQGIIKDLATMSLFPHPFHFISKRSASNPQDISQPNNKLTQNPTFAIFGSNDTFTSSKKFRAWAAGLEGESRRQSIDSDSDEAKGEARFRWKEVEDAGHFWHGRECVGVLREEVRRFLEGL